MRPGSEETLRCALPFPEQNPQSRGADGSTPGTPAKRELTGTAARAQGGWRASVPIPQLSSPRRVATPGGTSLGGPLTGPGQCTAAVIITAAITFGLP